MLSQQNDFLKAMKDNLSSRLNGPSRLGVSPGGEAREAQQREYQPGPGYHGAMRIAGAALGPRIITESAPVAVAGHGAGADMRLPQTSESAPLATSLPAACAPEIGSPAPECEEALRAMDPR